MAFNSDMGYLIGGVAGAVLGRVVQKYFDLQYKVKLMRDSSEAHLTLPEIERKRKLEDESNSR
jgi:hypothetical protein